MYANDDGWKCLLTNGVAGEIPAVLEASFFDKGGQVRLHSSQGNEDFDVVIPVLHNGAPIAYLLAGDTEEGTGVSPVVKHLRFIELLTNVLIVALQNKRLELERVRQEATRRELELAADLQSMLVPADWPVIGTLTLPRFTSLTWKWAATTTMCFLWMRTGWCFAWLMSAVRALPPLF